MDITIDIHDNPDEYKTEDDEAENLHFVYEDVLGTQIEAREISMEALGMRQRLDQIVSGSEAEGVKMVLDRQPQSNSNEVLIGQVQALTDAVNRLSSQAQAQPEGEQNTSARNWQRIKYIVAGGLEVFSFVADAFQIISFMASAVNGSVFLLAIAPLSDTGDPETKNQEAIAEWVNQDEDSFWKSQAAYYVPTTDYSLIAQLNNAQMIMYIASGSAKLNPVIRWHASEKLAVVQGLMNTYLGQGSRAMYLSVTSYKHGGNPLPRVAALDCVSLALVLVIKHLQTQRAALQSRTAFGVTGEATDCPPRHFEPIFVFQKAIAPGLDLRTYARQITLAWNAKMLIKQKNEPTQALFARHPPVHFINDTLSMDKASIVLSKFPDTGARRNVQKLNDQFLAMCLTTYPLLPGETITENHLAVLTGTYHNAVKGAVAYSRTTNKAQVVFIPYQVQFDMSSGTPALVYRSTAKVSTLPKMAANTSDADFFKEFIGPVSQTLAFAVPPPWGIIASAGFQILDEIFGSLGSGPSLAQVIANLLTQAVEAIKNLLLEDDVRKATNSINAFIGWLSSETTVLQSLTSGDEIWITQTIQTLSNANDPSFTGNILNDLVTLTSPELCTIYKPNSITLAFMAATSLFLSYRLRCQLYALLASIARGKGDTAGYDANAGEFYILIIEFSTTLETWIGTLQTKLSDLVQARLNCVTPVHYYDYRGTYCEPDGPNGLSVCTPTGSDGYSCGDTFTNATVAAMANERWTSGCCGQNDHFVSHEGDVDSLHDAYVAQLNGQLNAQYADYYSAIQDWTTSLGKVKAMMPPQQPSAPSISGWVRQAPSPDLQGKQVQYLVEFANGKGPSTISDGSGYADIVAGQAPQVTIPTDPTGAATKRNVYRQLIDSAGDTRDRSLADIVADNTTTAWVDNPKTGLVSIRRRTRKPYANL